MEYSKHILDSTVAVFDIETPYITKEGLGALDTIYCIAVTIIDKGIQQQAKLFTEYWTPYSDGSINEALPLINSCDFSCGHNIQGFDNYVTQNITGIVITNTQLDTLILSKLIYSKDELFSIDASLDIPKGMWGKYSLKAFGMRLGDYKIDFTEFDEGLTHEMAIYCIQDTDVTAQLLLHLLAKPNFPIEPVIALEHQVAAIIQEQTECGFYLDIDKANALNTKLLTEKAELSASLTAMFSPKFLPEGKEKQYKKQSITRKFLPNFHYIPLLGTKAQHG